MTETRIQQLFLMGLEHCDTQEEFFQVMGEVFAREALWEGFREAGHIPFPSLSLPLSRYPGDPLPFWDSLPYPKGEGLWEKQFKTFLTDEEKQKWVQVKEERKGNRNPTILY